MSVFPIKYFKIRQSTLVSLSWWWGKMSSSHKMCPLSQNVIYWGLPHRKQKLCSAEWQYLWELFFLIRYWSTFSLTVTCNKKSNRASLLHSKWWIVEQPESDFGLIFCCQHLCLREFWYSPHVNFKLVKPAARPAGYRDASHDTTGQDCPSKEGRKNNYMLRFLQLFLLLTRKSL